MTDQLSLYNGALTVIGEGELDALTENREARHVLDGVWDRGAVDSCLEMGDWNFATRTVQASYDPDLSPSFGFQYSFTKPTDLVRLTAISDDPYLARSLGDAEYRDENGRWWCDHQTLYVTYVSNDSSYGTDYSLWPQSFTRFVEAYLANQIIARVRQAAVKREEVLKAYETSKSNALSKDALSQGVKFLPESGWAGARRRGSGRRDRGSRGRLTG